MINPENYSQLSIEILILNTKSRVAVLEKLIEKHNITPLISDSDCYKYRIELTVLLDLLKELL